MKVTSVFSNLPIHPRACASGQSFSIHWKFVLHSPSAPTSPPDNVNAVNISSTVIRVTWEEVPAIDQNGIITQYEVEYNQSTFSGATMSATTTVDSSTFTVDLTGLEEYVEYSIRVRAYTSVGAGPYSDVVIVTTNEDGKKHGLLCNTASIRFCFMSVLGMCMHIAWHT